MVRGVNDGTDWGTSRKKVSWSYEDASGTTVFTGVSYVSSGASDGGSLTATGLVSGTRYNITADIWAYVGSSVVHYDTLYGVATTLVGDFVWTYTGMNNGTLIKGNRKISGYGCYVGASEWNALVNNVRAKLTVRGMYQESKYQLNAAIATSGSIISATKFNLVRYAIGSLASTGLGNKVTGDIIKASDLNLLMDKINTVSV